MSKTLKITGTKTEKLLVESYLAESTAYSRYTFYATQADKEDYYPIGECFRETAANELRHAKVYFKYLPGGQVKVSSKVDAGIIGDTATNLEIAAKEEKEEGYEFYRKAAKVARAEGFDEIADHFLAIADIEELHHKRFITYLNQVKEGTVWKRDKPIKWQCLVCGYEFEGTEPPKECPACDHPRCHYKALDIE